MRLNAFGSSIVRATNPPDVTVLASVARLLGVSVDWLLDGDESRDTFDGAASEKRKHPEKAGAVKFQN
ncbi:MAG: hypothetical protein HZB26_15410 [Candidatus Hydrogenedentes bacterium]|nr:hypothetical protein [Candidatus Hydrogenedentota bacterium]